MVLYLAAMLNNTFPFNEMRILCFFFYGSFFKPHPRLFSSEKQVFGENVVFSRILETERNHRFRLFRDIFLVD
jgi:hypothetical protein